MQQKRDNWRNTLIIVEFEIKHLVLQETAVIKSKQGTEIVGLALLCRHVCRLIKDAHSKGIAGLL